MGTAMLTLQAIESSRPSEIARVINFFGAVTVLSLLNRIAVLCLYLLSCCLLNLNIFCRLMFMSCLYCSFY